MNDKILFFLDMEWIHFGIAKFLIKQYDCEPFAVIDIDANTKKFFENQQIVKFNKLWFYRDYLPHKKFEVDTDYLKEFENKYHLNLWNIAFTERFFNQYNMYYHFNQNQILSILGAGCKFFEKILDEVKPNFLVIKFTDSHQSHLLHKLSKAKGIKTLMLGPTRFGYRYTIYDEYEKIDDLNPEKENKQRSEKELQNYLEKYNLTKASAPIIQKSATLPQRTKKYFNTLALLGSDDVKSYYAHYGKTRFKAITQFIFLKRWYRRSFIEKNFQKEIQKNTPFIYFPLHVDPERQTLIVAPFYTNQIELITNIAKSLPVGYKLFVKEHSAQKISGWREISYYKKILNLANVELLHPSLNSQELIKKCSLVITISGSTGLEATFFNKPVIVFSDIGYSYLPSVYRIKNMEELPEAIKTQLKKQVDFSALNEYVNLVERNSFELNLPKLYLDFQEYFLNEYSTARSKMPISKVNLFLENHKSEFEKLAYEHIKKIKQYNELK